MSRGELKNLLLVCNGDDLIFLNPAFARNQNSREMRISSGEEEQHYRIGIEFTPKGSRVAMYGA